MLVMPGLVPGIHVFAVSPQEDVDGRVKSGHDESTMLSLRTRRCVKYLWLWRSP
jgi:hypothetical protein